MLYGRNEQLAAIGRLLEGMRSGRAGVLVLRGEAGIGKTALLDAAEEEAAGARVLRVTGVESEAELPFAALHALMRPALDEIGTLPERQAVALRGAFGMAEAAVADRFLVGLAVLSLVAELAEARPVLVLVDDAQWLDRASAEALVFAARRLHAERAAVIVASRDEPACQPARPGGAAGGRPDRASAERLLAGEGLALAVRDQLIAEAAGQPAGPDRAVPRAVRRAAGRFGHPADPARRFSGRPGAAGVRRPDRHTARGGPAGGGDRRAGGDGRPGGSQPGDRRRGRVADRLGRGRASRAAAGDPGRGHLLSSAGPGGGPGRLDVAERMAGHQALAGVLDGDRRAWHLAALAAGPDEQVAAELDAAAQRAGRRGSRAAMAAAYERAAGLSADPAARGRRLALAAEAAADAGQQPRAADLAEQAGRLVTDPGHAAMLARVRASCSSRPAGPPMRQAFCWTGPRCSAPRTRTPRRRW